MKMIPVFFLCSHARGDSILHVDTGFRKKYETDGDDNVVIDLESDGIELQLTSLPGNQKAGSAVNVKIESVDDMYSVN